MRKALFLFIASALLLWPACSKKAEQKARVEVIGGVEYIHNPETPVYPDRTVSFEEDLVIGGEDEEGNVVLFDPGLFFVDESGNVYISESRDQVFKVFSPDGQHMKTLGAKGSGPGEFQSIGFSGFTPDGRFLVTDYQARRTSLFDASGEFLKSFPWQKWYSLVHLVTDSYYLTSEYVYGEDRQDRKLFVKKIDFDGNEIGSYGEFTPPQTKMITQGSIAFGMSIPYSPLSLFAGDQDRGWLYHCMSDTYVIEVFDETGKLFRRIDRPYEPVPFTSDDAEEFRSRYENSTNEVLKKMVKDMELPKVKSVASRMLVDDRGYLWIQTNETEKEEDQTLTAYDVFSSDGYYDSRVWSALSPRLFKNGKMYRMETDEETGYRTLKRYNVTWR